MYFSSMVEGSHRLHAALPTRANVLVSLLEDLV